VVWASLIYYRWTNSDEYLATLGQAALARAQKEAGDNWVQARDANSIIWRYRASKGHDVSKPFGDDMRKALARAGEGHGVDYARYDAP
jgi:homoserine acetyltransferase